MGRDSRFVSWDNDVPSKSNNNDDRIMEFIDSDNDVPMESMDVPI